MESDKAPGWVPLWVRVDGSKCLVVGGGQVALRKIKMLLDRGAAIEVVAKRACEGVRRLAQDGRIALRMESVRQSHLRGARLVVVATDDSIVNQQVSNWAQREGILCNVVDKPELCTAVFPAVLSRGRLEVAVSTGGSSPAMAARIRDGIARFLGPGYEAALEILGQVRARVKAMDIAEGSRSRILRSLVDQELVGACERGDLAKIREMIQSRLDRAMAQESGAGQASPAQTGRKDAD
jgi:precorrin-2 dehydrogenase/sirohydrochlorin ferrochelatase